MLRDLVVGDVISNFFSEIGVDLRDAGSKCVEDNDGGKINGLHSLITALPNQGVVGPYDKVLLTQIVYKALQDICRFILESLTSWQ